MTNMLVYDNSLSPRLGQYLLEVRSLPNFNEKVTSTVQDGHLNIQIKAIVVFLIIYGACMNVLLIVKVKILVLLTSRKLCIVQIPQ